MPYKDPEKKREYNSTYSRESRAYWKSLHRCTDCHGQDAFTLNGRARCAECNERRREYSRRYRESNRAKIAELDRKRTADRKSAGLCIKCGREMEDVTHTRCPSCLARDAMRHRKEDLRGVGGLCSSCGKQNAKPGGKLCPACYETALKNLAKANAVMSTDNHPWRRDEQLRFMSITGRAG